MWSGMPSSIPDYELHPCKKCWVARSVQTAYLQEVHHVVVRLDGLSSIRTRFNHVSIGVPWARDFTSIGCFSHQGTQQTRYDNLPFCSGSDTPTNLSRNGSICLDNISNQTYQKHIHSRSATRRRPWSRYQIELIPMAFWRGKNAQKESTPPESQEEHVYLNFFTDLFWLHLDEVIHSPVTFGTTDIQSKGLRKIS